MYFLLSGGHTTVNSLNKLLVSFAGFGDLISAGVFVTSQICHSIRE